MVIINALAALKIVITHQLIVLFLLVHHQFVRMAAAMPMKTAQTVLRIVHHNATAATEFAALEKVTLIVRGTAMIMAAGFSRRQTRSPEAPGIKVLLARPETRVTAIMHLSTFVNQANQKPARITSVQVCVCRLRFVRRLLI